MSGWFVGLAVNMSEPFSEPVAADGQLWVAQLYDSFAAADNSMTVGAFLIIPLGLKHMPDAFPRIANRPFAVGMAVVVVGLCREVVQAALYHVSAGLGSIQSAYGVAFVNGIFAVGAKPGAFCGESRADHRPIQIVFPASAHHPAFFRSFRQLRHMQICKFRIGCSLVTSSTFQ